MKKIRVLHCLETVGSGGVEQTRLSLAQRLNGDAYEQRLVCTKAVGALPARFSVARCRIDEIGEFKNIFDSDRYRRALKIIREYRPHIIHGAVYEGVALAVIAGRLGQVPIIIGEETSDPVERRFQGHVLYRLLAGLTNHMVAISPAVMNYLVGKLRIPSARVTLINNGVTEQPSSTAAQIFGVRERFGLGPEAYVIGTVGRLFDDYKRVSDLIRALALIRNKSQNAHLMIVGDGPDRSQLFELAEKLGVAQWVHFAGYQGDTQPFYGAMDVFALASASEAFGLVLVEAMFAGLPVIATRVGGIPSVVDEGSTGVLVPPLSPERFAEELLKLATDEGMRREMGARGRERARAVFSAERYVDEVDRLYQTLSVQAGLR